jgi:hypothetical protein
LVNAGLIALAPSVRLNDVRNDQGEMWNLQRLYRSAEFRELLNSSIYLRDRDNLADLGVALGQFASRNAEFPRAQVWIGEPRQNRALAELGRVLAESIMPAGQVALYRLSTFAGIDPLKCSDEDLITMRRDEELFSLWRAIISTTLAELANHDYVASTDIEVLINSQQAYWKSALDERIGRSKSIREILDTNAITCGLITGGMAIASGASLGMATVAGLGEGLAIPLLNLFAGANVLPEAMAKRRALTRHFMALGGSSE